MDMAFGAAMVFRCGRMRPVRSGPLDEIHQLDSWIVGLGWADLTWQACKIEHVCHPQPTDRSQVLLNVSDGPGVVEEAIKVLTA